MQGCATKKIPFSKRAINARRTRSRWQAIQKERFGQAGEITYICVPRRTKRSAGMQRGRYGGHASALDESPE